jgi:hypothetical protein
MKQVRSPRLPAAPRSIQKGSSLTQPAVDMKGWPWARRLLCGIGSIVNGADGTYPAFLALANEARGLAAPAASMTGTPGKPGAGGAGGKTGPFQ